jgi:hypothetical protein
MAEIIKKKDYGRARCAYCGIMFTKKCKNSVACCKDHFHYAKKKGLIEKHKQYPDIT